MSYGDEGALFEAAFAELKSLVDDDPESLKTAWEEKEGVAKLCDKIMSQVRLFEEVEETLPHAFTPNVSKSGVRARREFDERWREGVSYVANREFREILSKLVINLDFDDDSGPAQELAPPDPLADKIADWKYDASEEASAIESMADYAFDHAEDLGWVDSSLEAWEKLKAIGLDLKGALWRRRSIPFILVPPQVSSRYGKDRASLYRRLHQAGLAFIFGAPLASLSLQRAVMEEVLMRHWGAEKGWVRDAGLPELPWGIRADQLKKMAGDALHGDPEKYSSDELDRRIIKNFLLLRILIENAPEDLEAHKQQKK